MPYHSVRPFAAMVPGPMEPRRHKRREPCGGHPGLRRESVHQPMSRLSQHVPPACRRYDPDCKHHASSLWRIRRPSVARQAKLSANRRDSGWRRRPKPCAQRAGSMTVPTVRPVFVAALATAQDPGRVAMRIASMAMSRQTKPSPHRAFSMRQHVRFIEKAAALEATAERASRHAEGRPWLTIHYTHKIYP